MNVLMPQLGETVSEGTIAVWHKKVGDTIAKDEPLLDVETDKAAIEVPASNAGVISAINVSEGDTVDVGTVLAVIDIEGEEPAAAETTSQTPEPVKAAPAEVAVAEVATTVATTTAEPISSTASAAPTGAVAKSGAMLSPAVRKLVSQNNLDVSSITATGKKGRVTRQDVLAFIAGSSTIAGGLASTSAPVAAPAQPAATGRTTPVPVPTPIGADARSLIPFDRIRKLTADHMVMSRRPAHTYYRPSKSITQVSMPYVKAMARAGKQTKVIR